MSVTEQVGPIPDDNEGLTETRLYCYTRSCRCVHSAMHDDNYPYCGAQASQREYMPGSIWSLIRRMSDSKAFGCPFDGAAPKGTVLDWEQKVQLVTLSQHASDLSELMHFIDSLPDVDSNGLEMILSVVPVSEAAVKEHAATYSRITDKYVLQEYIQNWVTETKVQHIKAVLRSTTGLSTPVTFADWKAAYSSLTECERAFVRQVRDHDSCKLSLGRYNTQAGAVHAVWTRPEELGLVVCVGSYKWHCTMPDPLLEGN